MGKKRITVVDDQTIKKVKKEKSVKKPVEVVAEVQPVEEKPAVEKAEKKIEEKPKEEKGAKTPRSRSQLLLAARSKVEPHKSYPLIEAIKLVKEISISKFIGSVDAHLIVREASLTGEIEFPHPTGKEAKIRIADDEVLEELEKGVINFTTLIATPAIMPKLAKYARLLGPRGLMPNPKSGTISDKPEALEKSLAGKYRFKTEAKAPLIHITIGKVKDKDEELADNFRALITAVARKNVVKAVLAPTMGPGVLIDLETL